MTIEKLKDWWGRMWPLLLGVAVLCGLWVFWSRGGATWSHTVMAEHLVPASESVLNTASNPKVAAPAPAPDQAQLFSELGQTGDSFGGLNTLFTAIGGAVVAWAGHLQHIALKEARSEAKEERASRKRQEFEALFFRLLELNAEVAERVRRKGSQVEKGSSSEIASSAEHRGTRALESYAATLYNSVPLADSSSQAGGNLAQDLRAGDIKVEKLHSLVKKFVCDVYDSQPSAFGPYFRTLYQTFKYISESGLAEEEQIRYANIARAQISEGAALLLALNGLTMQGRNFARFIEKFGLLEHLHRRYKTDLKSILTLGLRERAFGRPEVPAQSINGRIQGHLLPEEFFESIEKERELQSQFESGWREIDEA